MSQFIPVSNVVNVSLLAPGPGLSLPNMSALAIVTQAAKPGSWTGSQTYAIYRDPTAVADDWGTSSDMAAMATAVFSQSPNLLTGGGYLVIIPRLQTPSLETVQACLVRMANQVFFEGFLVDSEYGSDTATFLTLSSYVQGTSMLFFYCSSDIAALQPGSYLDQVRTAGNTRTRCLYYGGTLTNGQTQIFAAAYAGRGMSINFSGARTVLSMNLQTLQTIDVDLTLTTTTYLQALAAGIDIYISYSGVPSVVSSGANLFYDQVYCRTWLQFQLQVNGFNYLKSAAAVPGKIPQTEEGMAGLRTAYTAAFLQGVTNGYMAPGTWTLPFTFGDPADYAANITAYGYYIVSLPIATQSVTDRNDRKAPLVQAAVKEAGAIQSSSVIVYVNA